MLMFYTAVLFLHTIDAVVQECVLIFIVTMIENPPKKTCTVIYIHKIPDYNMVPKMRVMIPLRTYFWTD